MDSSHSFAFGPRSQPRWLQARAARQYTRRWRRLGVLLGPTRGAAASKAPELQQRRPSSKARECDDAGRRTSSMPPMLGYALAWAVKRLAPAAREYRWCASHCRSMK